MSASTLGDSQYDDPRKLRELLVRVGDLSRKHALPCVLVGLAANEGDRVFPEMVEFVESELRVEDAIFRMTRERAVILLTDVDHDAARSIVERVIGAFHERFPVAREPQVALGYYEVVPGTSEVTVKEVLPAIFNGSPVPH
jgi:hypothetical protein